MLLELPPLLVAETERRDLRPMWVSSGRNRSVSGTEVTILSG